MSVTAGARMARAQLAHLEAEGKLDETLRYEILGGELVIQGLPSIPHERAVAVLFRHLAVWTHEHGGEVFAGAGIEIGDHALQPDLSFIGPERVEELDEDGFHVPPDLVVEVASPRGRGRDLVDKRDVYAEIGVPEYWVVDLAEQRVVVHRPDDAGADEAAAHHRGALTPRRAPGLTIPLAELFGGS